LADIVPREALAVGCMAAILLWLGLYPQPVIATFQPVATSLQATYRAATVRERSILVSWLGLPASPR
jgi:NADH:ubiquinone oxidoreductase subunit 4 (subunit M)